MGVEPPYIYQRPTQTSFIAPRDQGRYPKSVTEASWTPIETRPRQDDNSTKARNMNQHPDSHFIVPYGNLNWKPMEKSTKDKVKWVRIVLLNLRFCTLLGALGLLFCVITIKPTGSILDWILRVTPGIGLLQSMYAIYHLVRPAKTRTPASSASYMAFAAVIDAGIIPFFAFAAFMANEEYYQPTETADHWTTLFPTHFQTQTIIYATYLISIASASAHVVSFVISVYLCLVFRRISKLPPDMNPLEDNLTSRHKRNKSSISTLSMDPPHTASSPNQPLMEGSRSMQFIDTRPDSAISPNTSPKHRYGQPGAHGYHFDFHGPHRESVPHSSHSQYSDLRRSPNRSKKHASAPSGPNGVPNGGPVRPKSHIPGLLSDNWFIHSSPPASSIEPTNRIQPPELQHLRQGRGPVRADFAPPFQSKGGNKYQKFDNVSPKPLGMNPPTPTRAGPGHVEEYATNPYRSPTRESRQALRALANTPAGPNGSPMTWEEVNLRPSKAHKIEEIVDVTGQGKTRFYGSLRGMIGGQGHSKGRVISSGIDDGAERKKDMRNREVSGKLAEEGRGVVQH